MDKYYELSKRRKISQVSDKIAAAFDESDPDGIDSIVEDLAYENSMTIAVTDWNGNPVSTADFMGGYSVITSDKSYILFGYRNELLPVPKEKNTTYSKTKDSEPPKYFTVRCSAPQK